MIIYIVLREIINSQFALHFNESGSDCLALAVKWRLRQVSLTQTERSALLVQTTGLNQPANGLLGKP